MIDLGVIRGSGTLVLLMSFVGLCMWAWSPARRRAFDEAARLPFLDEENPRDTVSAGAGGRASA